MSRTVLTGLGLFSNQVEGFIPSEFGISAVFMVAIMWMYIKWEKILNKKYNYFLFIFIFIQED